MYPTAYDSIGEIAVQASKLSSEKCKILDLYERQSSNGEGIEFPSHEYTKHLLVHITEFNLCFQRKVFGMTFKETNTLLVLI